MALINLAQRASVSYISGQSFLWDMTRLVTRAIRHFRTHGIVSTAIAIAVYFKNRFETEYYTERVAATAQSVGPDLSVNGPSQVTENTSLGENVNFNGLRISGGGAVTIGDNFHSGPDCLILTQNHNFNNGDAIPYDDSYICKDVKIKDNVWIGTRVTIIPGVTIKEGAIIQAGSTVTQDIPKGAIAGGHPAEVFAHRDMDHYRRLKKACKFH